MQLVKGLMSRLANAIARVKRTGDKVKTGAVVSRPVVKSAPRAADLHIVPAGHFGGVWFREVVFTTAAGAQVARAARAQASERAFRSTSGSDKFLPRRKGVAGIPVKAGPVPNLGGNAAKKEVVKRVKKNVPAIVVRRQAAKAAAVIVAVREIVAMRETAKAALSTAKGQSLKAAKAVLAEIKGLLGIALQTARAISREVAV